MKLVSSADWLCNTKLYIVSNITHVLCSSLSMNKYIYQQTKITHYTFSINQMEPVMNNITNNPRIQATYV